MILPGFGARLAAWSRMFESWDDIVTLTLDLSRSGPLPAETRQYFKRALKAIREGGRTRDATRALRAMADQIEDYVLRRVRPESEGLFLTSGPELWDAIELPLPLRNSLWMGSTPYVAPLLELEERAPRSLVINVGRRAVAVWESYLGFLEPLTEVALPTREGDPQRRVNLKQTPLRASGARFSRRSDSTNQKRRRHDDERMEAVFRSTGQKVAQAARRIRPEAILLLGERWSLSPLLAQLPGELADRTQLLGPALGPEHRIRKAVPHALEQRVRDRRYGEIRRLLNLRSEGHLISLGPSSAIARLGEGTGLRFYVDPYDPLPGGRCENCGARFADLRPTCGFCGEEVRPVSLTQEIMSARLSHPDIGVTFVSRPAKWLDDLGGLAAIRKPLKVG
jgi:hypothetical protein